MRIQHNILAMNAYRNYNTNTSALGKNLEKLSSGYKINRAGDDAAGLAISEKMRAQITGLGAAQKNVKDGVSLVKTAEGAMQEIQDMLNRMDYLATQSANGTYQDAVDRENLQKEVDALKTEINRIADSANFNGIKLLDGSLDKDADFSTKVDFAVGDTLPALGQELGVNTVLHNKALSNSGTEFDIDLHNFKFDANTGDTMTMKVGDTTFELTATTAVSGGLTGSALASAILGGQSGVDVTITQSDGTVTSVTGGTAITGLQINGQEFTVSTADRLNDGSNALHFVQTNAPKSTDNEVNGAMVVTVSGAKAGVAGVYTVDLAGLTSVTGGDVVTIGGYSVTINNGDTAGAIAGAFSGATGITGFDVTVSGTVVTLTATTAGTAGAAKPTANFSPAVTTATTATATITTATTAADASAAKTQSYTVSSTTTLYDGTTAITSAQTDVAIVGQDWKWTAADDGSGTAYNVTYTYTGSATGAVTGPDNTTVAGTNATTGVYEYTLTGWDETSTVTIGANTYAAAAILDGSVTAANHTITYDADTKKLTFTAKTAGVAGQLTGDATYVKEPVSSMTLDVGTATEPKDGGDIPNITQGANGDWNVSTTNIKNVTSDGLDRLASTAFTLTEEMATEGSKIKVGDETYTFTADEDLIGTAGYVDISSGDIEQIAMELTNAAKDNKLYTVGNDGSRMTFTETVTHAGFATTADYPADDWDLSKQENIEKSLSFTPGANSIKSGKALTLQIGDTSDDFNQMKVSVGDMHTKAMGTKDGKSIADIDISTQDGASEAVNVIKDAINYVSSVRGDLGAIQNRLEHTQNNLSVMAENITDAESTIRDTDVAEEMMSYVKNNILVQSAQAMLAQANQVPQGVLQLLG